MGPTSSNPSPTLFNVVITEEIVVVISKLLREIMSVPIKKTRKYAKK